MVARFRALGAERHASFFSDPWAASFTDEVAVSDADRYILVHPHSVLYLALRTSTFDDEVRRAIEEIARTPEDLLDYMRKLIADNKGGG